MDYIIQTHQLSKHIAGKLIVSDLNMRVKQGEIYGLIGPNGAGKTSLFKLLCGLWRPTGGEIDWFGEPIRNYSYQQLRHIGSLISEPLFYLHMTGKQNLTLHARYMGIFDPKISEEALALLDLTDVAHKPVHTYSIGSKKRLAIARAISLHPSLLILDEPTSGLDPLGIRKLKELLIQLNRQHKMTIILSSHHIEEIEQLAHTVGILSHGKLLQEARMDQLRNVYPGYVVLTTEQVPKSSYILESILNIRNFKVIDRKTIHIYDLTVPTALIVKTLVGHHASVEEIKSVQPPLEDYFVKWTEGVSDQ